VAVVPLRIAAGDAGERLRDLVQRVFIESGEQVSLLSRRVWLDDPSTSVM
jgi:hypothetical protein